MAQTDFSFLNDGLDIATVDRGVTAGISRPPGGISRANARSIASHRAP